ncbi:MAG: 3-dehydroquinate dehydratase [Actinobacteria bacterium]|nr:3-dehydroquinate dehydratase [Actinomycetota bacterium]
MAGRRILLLNGPNLDLLGTREPSVYGSATLAEHVTAVEAACAGLGWSVTHLQSNSEAELVSAIHAARGTTDAVIINPGAFTHYSWAIHDALAAYDGPIVEVHLSQPLSRESWRHTSVVAPVAIGTVAGFGGVGYGLAVEALSRHFAAAK